tara:strand:- start:2396 stop:2539 length:144 start_codon:yes stop_codon:yes gene_type:complete
MEKPLINMRKYSREHNPITKFNLFNALSGTISQLKPKGKNEDLINAK